jgi:hypothetical protein
MVFVRARAEWELWQPQVGILAAVSSLTPRVSRFSSFAGGTFKRRPSDPVMTVTLTEIEYAETAWRCTVGGMTSRA